MCRLRTLASAVFGLAAIAVVLAEKRYDGYSVIEVFVDTDEKVAHVKSLETNDPIDGPPSSIYEIDIWTDYVVNGTLTVAVSPAAKGRFLDQMRSWSIAYAIVNENIQKAIDEEQHPSLDFQFLSYAEGDEVFFSKFQPLDKIHEFMYSLEKDHPDLVAIEKFGESHEGRPLLVAKVGRDRGQRKPAIWIDGGVHAREWISISTVTYLLNKLVKEEASPLIDNLTWYIVPVLNVDGYEHTFSHRMWRKNRRPSTASCSDCCAGVDLNRNFDYHYVSEQATRTSTCNDTYPGAEAFSENESRAVRDFVMAHREEIKVFFNLHAYGQMWMYPFAGHTDKVPENLEEMKALSRGATEALAALRGTTYRVGTPREVIYPAAGSSLDWAHGAAKIPFSFSLELPPPGNSKTGFVVSPSNIIPTGEETWAAVSYVAKEILQRYG